MESWAVSSFRFQWQNVNDEYLRPGFALISPQRKSKFRRQRNKSIVIFGTVHSLVNNRSYQIVFSIGMELENDEYY